MRSSGEGGGPLSLASIHPDIARGTPFATDVEAGRTFRKASLLVCVPLGGQFRVWEEGRA